MLPMLIESLNVNAREIDQTFARAGGQLGEGLNLFEELKQRLSTLAAELGGSELCLAGATLAGLADELRAIGIGLGREMGALKALATHSHAASQVLDGLLDHIRLITILARSARIEAVSVEASSSDFGNFTNEIIELTSQAQRTIQDCARDHDHLIALLGAAITAQCEFEQRYGAALLALAVNLEQTLAEVAERQRRGIDLTSEAAVHSGKVVLAACSAITALQSGDSIRQRLEHAIATLHLLAAVEAGTGDAASLDELARKAASIVLSQLGSAQLDAIAAKLGEDAEAIEAALALLAGDRSELLVLVNSLYSGDGGASFLGVLEADLAEVSALLGKCDRARAGIDRVTQTLTGVLETCQQTVAALAGTVSSIVLIGTNAGLRAARVGTGGRSLTVIAQELKVAADQIARDAAHLTPVFVQMREEARGLTHGDGLDAAHFAALDQSMRDALAAMRKTGDRMSAALGQLAREGGSFGNVLTQARLSFSNTGATRDLIAGAAVELGRVVAGTNPEPDKVALIGELLQHHVWPRYTMAVERTIHQAVLTEHGVPAHTVVVGLKLGSGTGK